MKQMLWMISLSLVSIVGLSAADLRVGAVTSVWNTRGVEVFLEAPPNWLGEEFRPEVGVELGLSNQGTQILVPVGLVWELFLEKGWSWGAAVHGLAGAGFSASPLAVLWGVEGELRSEWSWTPGLAVGLSAGVRYAAATVEFPVHLSLEFALGPEDTLEPAEHQNKE